MANRKSRKRGRKLRKQTRKLRKLYGGANGNLVVKTNTNSGMISKSATDSGMMSQSATNSGMMSQPVTNMNATMKRKTNMNANANMKKKMNNAQAAMNAQRKAEENAQRKAQEKNATTLAKYPECAGRSGQDLYDCAMKIQRDKNSKEPQQSAIDAKGNPIQIGSTYECKSLFGNKEVMVTQFIKGEDGQSRIDGGFLASKCTPKEKGSSTSSTALDSAGAPIQIGQQYMCQGISGSAKPVVVTGLRGPRVMPGNYPAERCTPTGKSSAELQGPTTELTPNVQKYVDGMKQALLDVIGPSNPFDSLVSSATTLSKGCNEVTDADVSAFKTSYDDAKTKLQNAISVANSGLGSISREIVQRVAAVCNKVME